VFADLSRSFSRPFLRLFLDYDRMLTTKKKEQAIFFFYASGIHAILRLLVVSEYDKSLVIFVVEKCTIEAIVSILSY
jgi:hypothetical protein